MTEGLPANLVRTVLRSARKEDTLDPFLGCGTVLLEANKAGRRAVGVDVNPFMCFVSYVKNSFGAMSPQVFAELIGEARIEPIWSDSIQLPKTVRTYYSDQRIKNLLCLRKSILDLPQSIEKEALKLAFVKALVNYGNIKLSPAPRLLTKTCPNLLSLFQDITLEIQTDLIDEKAPTGQVEIYKNDSRDLGFLEGEKFGLILTSPPYCNNVDFVRHTQLQLFWLGFCREAEDLCKIRRESVTSCEAMAYAKKDEEIDNVEVRRVATQLRRRSNRGYHRIVTQYFAGMNAHFCSAKRVIRKNGKIVYVIGDSWIQGVYIPTHRILRQLAKKAGFKSIKVNWIRTRNSARQHSHPLGEYVLTARG
jgi:DNA modification methylase